MRRLPAPVNPRTMIGSTLTYQASRLIKLGGYTKRASIGEHWTTDVEVYDLGMFHSLIFWVQVDRSQMRIRYRIEPVVLPACQSGRSYRRLPQSSSPP